MAASFWPFLIRSAVSIVLTSELGAVPNQRWSKFRQRRPRCGGGCGGFWRLRWGNTSTHKRNNKPKNPDAHGDIGKRKVPPLQEELLSDFECSRRIPLRNLNLERRNPSTPLAPLRMTG